MAAIKKHVHVRIYIPTLQPGQVIWSIGSLFVWVLPVHTNIPDPDQKYLVIMYIKNCNKRSIFSNRAVTNISRMRS